MSSASMSRSLCRSALWTWHWLDPLVLDGLDAVALVVWVCSGEVTVGEEAADDVPAAELEVFVVAHVGPRLEIC
jgi:hypothetical protein